MTGRREGNARGIARGETGGERTNLDRAAVHAYLINPCIPVVAFVSFPSHSHPRSHSLPPSTLSMLTTHTRFEFKMYNTCAETTRNNNKRKNKSGDRKGGREKMSVFVKA